MEHMLEKMNNHNQIMTPSVAVPLPEYFAKMKQQSTNKEDFVKNVPLKQAPFKDRFIYENPDPGYWTPQSMDCEDTITTYFLSPRKVVCHTNGKKTGYFTVDSVYVFTQI